MFPLIDQLVNDPIGFLGEAAYRVPAILIALVFHEWAHGFVAYRLGDPTAKMMGRLTINPLKHLDPLGTFMMFFVGFGWAKPVPINPNNFLRPRRDDFLVSIAGITMNLLLYLSFILLYYRLYLAAYPIVLRSDLLGTIYLYLYRATGQIAQVNLYIAIFNLLPIPPLDGYHVFNDLIFKGKLFAEQNTGRIGMGLILALSLTGWLGKGLSFVAGGVLDGTFWVLERLFGA